MYCESVCCGPRGFGSASEPAISSNSFIKFIDLDDLRGGDDLNESVPGPVVGYCWGGGGYPLENQQEDLELTAVLFSRLISLPE